MKNKLFFIAISVYFILIAGCTQKQNDNDIPDAFEQNASINIISKRSYNDLISEMYNEILEKNKELKKLDEKIKNLKKETSEKTEKFDVFFENNQKYYEAAYERIEIIQDSVLREKIFEKLSKSENNFNTKTENATKILTEITEKQAELNDLYTALKILTTLNENENYQNKNIPDTANVSELIKKYQEILRQTENKINN